MEILEIHFDSIDSTSAYAKREYASFPADKMTCISAETQTAGKGRYQRKWISPKGVNLYVTLCFRRPLDLHPARGIPGVERLAMNAARLLASLLEEEGLQPQIKWPNDIQLNGKKVSGVLCEVIFEKTWVQVILGIGLNVNMEAVDLEQIDQPATSLKAETGRLWDRSTLLKNLQARLSAEKLL